MNKLALAVTTIVALTGLGVALAIFAVSSWDLMDNTALAVLTTIAIVALVAGLAVLAVSYLGIVKIERPLAAIPAGIGVVAGIAALLVWAIQQNTG